MIANYYPKKVVGGLKQKLSTMHLALIDIIMFKANFYFYAKVKIQKRCSG